MSPGAVSPATPAVVSPSPPAPFAGALAGEDLLAWTLLDLTPAGTFGDELVAATARELLVVAPGGVRERAPLCKLALVERRGYLALVRADGASGAEGAEVGRATPAALAGMNAFADAVGRFLAKGERPVAPTYEPDPCPVCGGARPGGRCPRCRRWHVTARRLGAELVPFAPLLALACGLLVAGTVVGLAPPLLTKTLVDDVLKAGASAGSLARVVGLMGAVLIGTHVIGYARRGVESRLRGGLAHALRVRAFAAATALSLKEVARVSTAGLAQVVIGDTGGVVGLLIQHGLTGVYHVLMVLGVVVTLAVLSPGLALCVLVPAPPALALVWFLSRRGRMLVTRGWIEQLLVSHRAHGLAAGFRIVKAFGAESTERARFTRQSQSLRDWEHTIEMHYGQYAPVLSLITGAGSLLIWGYGGWLVIHGHLGVGSLVAYIGYLSMLYSQLQSLSQVASALPRAWTSAEHYLELLDTVPSVRSSQRPAPLVELTGAITLARVCFSYVPGREVLHDVDLSIAPGEFVGLVGRSGSGKTTLVNLIARFYDPTRGQVSIDGVPLPSIELALLRRSVGVVLQTPFLFDGTVLENLRLGAPDATLRAVCEAAERAQVHDMILDLPEGYDTPLGERQSLSAGEMQRLTIARALLADPRILILDEATASLDTRTELAIQEALAELTRGRTTIAIAHRLSTLARADRLIVLDGGRVVDSGTHAALAARPGIYRDLIDAQATQARGSAMRGSQGAP